MKPVASILLVAAMAVLAVAARVQAQDRPPDQTLARAGENPARPQPGLFGGGYGDWAQSLTFDVRVGGGYDGNVATPTLGTSSVSGANVASLAAPGSTMSTGQATLSYTISQKTFSLQASAAAWGDYYTALKNPLVRGGSGKLAFGWDISQRSSLTFSEVVADQPLYVLFPVQAAPDQLNLPADQAPLYSTTSSISTQFNEQTGLGFSQRLTERLTGTIGGTYFATAATAGAPQLQTETAYGSLAYALTKGLGLSIGYGRSDAHYILGGTRQTLWSSSVNGGLTFKQALSITRRTKLSFDFGTTVLRDGPDQEFRLNGNALLTREMGRTWTATLGYSRNVAYLQTFAAPVLADSLASGVSGLVSRRVSLQFEGGVARGTIGLGSGSNTFSNEYVTAGTSVAITQDLALRFDYTYLRYNLGSGVVLPTGVARELNRQSIRVTLDLLVPLLRVLRSPDATR